MVRTYASNTSTSEIRKEYSYDKIRIADKPSATLIVPAYNEEEGLPVVLRNIFDVLDDSYEVIVIDDGSTDRTSEVAADFPCRVIRHNINQGKGESLKNGIQVAIADIVMWIDADDTYPVETIPRMLDALSDGTDMVCASRMKGRDSIPAFNRIGNSLFCFLIRKVYGYGGKDPCTGLCAVKKEALLRMKLTGKRFTIDSEIAMKAGRTHLRVKEFPIQYRARIGRTKLSGLKDGARIMGSILRHLFWFPSRNFDNEMVASSALEVKD